MFAVIIGIAGERGEIESLFIRSDRNRVVVSGRLVDNMSRRCERDGSRDESANNICYHHSLLPYLSREVMFSAPAVFFGGASGSFSPFCTVRRGVTEKVPLFYKKIEKDCHTRV